MYPKVITYIYVRQDGKCAHYNGAMGMVGKEYEHEEVDWQPPDDWPYEVIDMRSPREGLAKFKKDRRA